jgi:hypothetical protein
MKSPPVDHRGARRPRRSAAGLVVGCGALMLLATLEAGATTIPVPERFLVQGVAAMTIAGPRCCDGYLFRGLFQASVTVEPTGALEIEQLAVQVMPTDLAEAAVLGLGYLPLRCAAVENLGPVVGSVSGGAITVPAGKAAVAATSFEKQAADGTCTEPNLHIEAHNNAAMSGTHDPAGNLFSLHGAFAAIVEGESYSIEVSLDGAYANRPPNARLGIVLPGFEQGGCPASWFTGNPAEWRIEANHVQGLKAPVRSFSNDPDTALTPRADLAQEVWTARQGADDELFLGSGPDLGERVFAYGPTHRLRLLAADQLGASSIDECTFRVVDTTPPVVTPPAPLAVRCSETWGATPASSPALAAFLAGAAAADTGDAAPLALPSRVGGVTVSPSTMFWLDAWVGPVPVEFRFRDASGNEAAATSSVSIYDDTPPQLVVSLSPSVVGADASTLVAVTASVTVSDACSPWSVWLDGIVSNAPAFDAGDVVDAAVGNDDRSFLLRARPAGPGAKRVYTVTYRALDLYGNGAVGTATFTVKAP